MQADIESDTELAEKKYRTVVKLYRYFPHRDYALLKICEILDLKSDWQKLNHETSQAMRIFPMSSYIMRFRFMNITSSIMLNRFEPAMDQCLVIAKSTHDMQVLSEAIFYLAEINRKKTGNSRSYLKNLAELAKGFKNSKIYPSILFKLAEFHRYSGNTDMAYSAYLDITKYFPESPESEIAISMIDKLKIKKPKFVNYIPEQSYIDSTSKIDIEPEKNVQGENSGIYYAVSIGPVSKKWEASRIRKLLKNYPENETIETNFGFTIYVGRFSNTDSALALRIRLAEEFGINGTIVRISEKKQRSYIYRD